MKKMYILIICLIFFSMVFCSCEEEPKEKLTYVSEESYFGDFSIENDVVTIKCSIVVKNNTDKDLEFYMYGDLSEDKKIGLVSENEANAFSPDDLKEKKKYSIKANSKEELVAWFKAKKGEKDVKKDREPPNKIRFEILDTK